LEAVKPEDYASGEGINQLLTSSFGWILMGSAIFGLIVGCGVASQTLRGAFLAQLTEFGALRALGVSKGRMALVALEQAWWTGLLSIPIAAILAHGIRLIAMQFDLTIALPNGLLMATSALLLLVALFAGLISLTAVTRVEPAELLR
jgi:putative ABC transport system permease protein